MPVQVQAHEAELRVAAALAAVKAAHFDAVGAGCDYAALGASRERGQLAASLGALETFDPKKVRIAHQTAFWINVYNAGVLRDAPELEVAAGERAMESFFERPRLKVFGQPFSLDDIYHGLLRGNAPRHGRIRAPMRRDDPRLAYMPIAFDERLHFALFRGTRSSPPLRVFEGGRLDADLEETAQAYVRAAARVEEGGAVLVAPRLMQWYAADFGGEHGVIEFVLGCLGDEASEAADRRHGDVRVRYADFDWALSARR